jgi:hypothetical protein
MTTEPIDPKRLAGACRKISCYIGEHEIAAVNKLFGELLDKEGRKPGAQHRRNAT